MAARLTALGATAWLPRVAVTIIVVLTASAASVLVRPLTHAADSPLFVAAVMVSAWYGGLGCGLLATALAALALDAEMASTRLMLAVNEEVVARLVVFVCVALFVSALDHARRRSAAQRGVFLEREQAARAEAEAANRAKDEFVADRALEAIRRNATLQARVIADLVDLSRLGGRARRRPRHCARAAPACLRALPAGRRARRALGSGAGARHRPSARRAPWRPREASSPGVGQGACFTVRLPTTP